MHLYFHPLFYLVSNTFIKAMKSRKIVRKSFSHFFFLSIISECFILFMCFSIFSFIIFLQSSSPCRTGSSSIITRQTKTNIHLFKYVLHRFDRSPSVFAQIRSSISMNMKFSGKVLVGFAMHRRYTHTNTL